ERVGIGILDDVVGTEALRGLEPETRGLRQHLPFQRDHREVAVEGAHPIGGDEDARTVAEIVVLAHLAAVIAGKLGNDGVGEGIMRVGSELGRPDHAPKARPQATIGTSTLLSRSGPLSPPCLIILRTRPPGTLAAARAAHFNPVGAPAIARHAAMTARTSRDFPAIPPRRRANP